MGKLHEIRTDKRGQAGGFLDHPIVYVIILFGLAAVIGSVMMALVAETDKAIPSNLEFGSVTDESWTFDSCDSGTYTKTLTHDSLDSDSVSVYNSTHTYTETTDYTVDYSAGTITSATGGALLPTSTDETWEFKCNDSNTHSKNLAHENICSGLVLRNGTGTTFTLTTDYTINTTGGILYNTSDGAIGSNCVGDANYTDTLLITYYMYQHAETLSVDYDYTAGKWGTSYSNVVAGVQLGFSMYKLVALMGIMSIVLPMLFLMFARRKEE